MHPERADRCLAAELHTQNDTLVRNHCNTERTSATPPIERARPNIPANSTLVFDVELVDFNPVAPPPALPTAASQPVTSDIIKVPSAEELKKGAKIEVIKPEDVDKEIAKEKARKEAEEKAAAQKK